MSIAGRRRGGRCGGGRSCGAWPWWWIKSACIGRMRSSADLGSVGDIERRRLNARKWEDDSRVIGHGDIEK